MARRVWHSAVVLLVVLFALSVAAQTLLYVNRAHWDSAYTLANEAAIYSVPPYLRSVDDLGGGRVALDLVAGGSAATVDTGTGPQPYEGRLAATLGPGLNRWTVTEAGRHFFLLFEYTPPLSYARVGNSETPNGVVSLRAADLPVQKPVFGEFSDWSPATDGGVPKQLLSEPPGGLVGDGPEKMMGRLIAMFQNRRGIPDDRLERSGWAEAAQQIFEGRSAAWCTQIAAIASGSLSPHFVVRMLASGGYIGAGGVQSGGHAFNEILDPTTGLWMLSDPTNYIAGVRWHGGRPVNALDFRRAVASPLADQFGSMDFHFWDQQLGDVAVRSWPELPDRVREDLLFYFSPRNRIHYHSGRSSAYFRDTWHNIDNWVRLDRRFVLSEELGPGPLPVVRITSLWLGAATGLLLLIVLTSDWRRRRKPAL